MTSYEEVKAALERERQEHLLRYWDELTETQRVELLSDIAELNLAEVNALYETASGSLGCTGATPLLDDQIRPLGDEISLSTARAPPDVLERYRREGLKAISESKVGVLLMAGGQGTRLGFVHPKGMYNVGLPSNKSLFHVQAQRIAKLQQLAGTMYGVDQCRITWCIMTSEHTMTPTREYFRKNHYFGLDPADVLMFEQGSLPCYDFQGRVLLDEKHRIARAPDGNGGLYRAVRDRGILDELEKRGVLYLHAHSVDNILIKVADPTFVGYCAEQRGECAAKVVEKVAPGEAVGVVCQLADSGKYQVVEYSEISKETSERRTADGSRLLFNAGNICNHFFTTAFLRKIGDRFEANLRLHVARKKIPYVDDETGLRCTPAVPNGIKIEKFVFDVFEFAERFLVMEVPREDEFSALKNADADGAKECPRTAKADLCRLHRKFLEAAGGTLLGGDVCEISPLLSYAGEGLEPLVKGKTFTSPLHLTEDD